MATPFDRVAEEGGGPDGYLKQIFDGHKPPITEMTLFSSEPGLAIRSHEDAGEERDEGEERRCGRGRDREPEERPESWITQNTEKIRHRLAHPNGPRPTDLMFPDRRPTHGGREAFDWHGGKDDLVSGAGNAVAELVIVSQAVHKWGEATKLLKVLPGSDHHGAQGEVQGF